MLISSKAWQQSITNTLRDHKKVDRFTAAIISAVTTNPALQECDPKTIINGALLGESLGLSPSPQLGQYYLVPFKQNEKRDREGNLISPKCTNAQFVLGYKGLVQLALRSGYYRKLTVVSVKEGELHNWNPITEDFDLTPIEEEGEREKARTVGYLASFEYLNGFTKTIYWSKNKMLAHANKYSQAFSAEAQSIKTKNGKEYHKVSFADYEAHNYPQKDEWLYSSFWYKDFDGMAHKTMLRQLISKWGVMSIDLQTAFEADAASESEEYFEVPEAVPSPAPDGPELQEEEIEAPEAPTQQEEQVSLSDV